MSVLAAALFISFVHRDAIDAKELKALGLHIVRVSYVMAALTISFGYQLVLDGNISKATVSRVRLRLLLWFFIFHLFSLLGRLLARFFCDWSTMNAPWSGAFEIVVSAVQVFSASNVLNAYWSRLP